jgi:hypothetical protein
MRALTALMAPAGVDVDLAVDAIEVFFKHVEISDLIEGYLNPASDGSCKSSVRADGEAVTCQRVQQPGTHSICSLITDRQHFGKHLVEDSQQLPHILSAT